jgi:hypothetical protein
MIIGSHEKALPVLGFLTPAELKSITVERIARAMVAA